MKMKFQATSKLLKTYLKKSGTTQRELADIVGVHIQYVSNISRGLSGIPALRAKKFAKVMNVSVESLAETAAKDFYTGYLKKS